MCTNLHILYICIYIHIWINVYTHTYKFTYIHTYIHIFGELDTSAVVKHFKDCIPGIFYILPMPESSVTNQRLI